jgi:hypothetical protein
MEESLSWEANQFAASQEIPCILWNPKVHCRIHKCPPPVSILSQLNPVITPTFHFLNIRICTTQDASSISAPNPQHKTLITNVYMICYRRKIFSKSLKNSRAVILSIVRQELQKAAI